MSSDQLLILILGLVAGFSLGWATAWRFARKLEAHDVVLADWDVPFDAQAPKAKTPLPFAADRQTSR